jgi:hypothetical protein
MTLHNRSRSARPAGLFVSIICLVIGGLGVGGLLGYAIWQDSAATSNQIQNGFATITAQLLDPSNPETPLDSVTSSSDTVLSGWEFTGNSTDSDAYTMQTAFTNTSSPDTSPSVTKAVQLQISGLRGNQGMDYSIPDLSTLSLNSASWAASSTISVWKSSTSSCDISEAGTNALATSGTLVNADYDNTQHAGKTSLSLTLCLNIQFDASYTYTNMGTATADLNGTRVDSCTWENRDGANGITPSPAPPTPTPSPNPSFPPGAEYSATSCIWTHSVIPDYTKDGFALPITLTATNSTS